MATAKEVITKSLFGNQPTVPNPTVLNNLTSNQTGANIALNNGQVVAPVKAPTVIPTIVPQNTKTQSTTTLSSNKTNDILANNNTLQNVSTKGVTTDPNTGIATTANGTPYNPMIGKTGRMDYSVDPNGIFIPVDPVTGLDKPQTTKTSYTESTLDTTDEDDVTNQILATIKAQTDALTASRIEGIQSRFNRYREEQSKINESTLANTNMALIRSGAAKGDVFADDAVKVRLEQNAKEIQNLDDKENELINDAKLAQSATDFKIMEMKLSQIAETRKAKVEATQKLNEELIKAEAKQREKQEAIDTENAISQLYNQGITDPSKIASEMKKAGYTTTLKEIKDATDLLSGVGGSGIVGEYNFYKSEAIRAGQVPMSFNQYQDVDANRKRSIASAGVAGTSGGGLYSLLPSKIADKVIAQGDKFGTSDIVKKYNNIIAASNLIAGVDPNTQNPAEHQAIVYNFAKALDPDSVVREGEYATIKKYSQSLAQKYSGELRKAIAGKGFLSKEAILAIQEAVDNRITAYEPQYDNLKKETARRINSIAGKDVADMVLLDYEEGYSLNNELITNENDAKSKIINYGKSNPTFQPIITKKVNETNPFTGQKYTYVELLELYPEIK